MNVPLKAPRPRGRRDTGRGPIASFGRIPRSAPNTGITAPVGSGDNNKEPT
jgi:hypothetical protein